MSRVLLAALTTLVVPACATPPPPSEVALPLAMPDHWTAAPLDAGTLDDAWWRAFDDPELDRLVAEALTRNPTLAEAATRIEAALGEARRLGAGRIPALSAGAGASRSRRVFFSPFGDPDAFRSTHHDVSLNFDWELDLWGRIRAGKRGAIADAQALEAAYHGARVSLIAQVVKAYFRVAERTRQRAIAAADLESAERLARRIEERYRAGTRTALDLELARSDAARSRAALAALETGVESARRQLEVLLGRYPAGAVTARANLPEEVPLVPAGVPAEVLWRRPDLVRAERELAASDERVTAARAALLPRLALTASAGTVAEDLADIVDKDFGVWNIAANLVAPLFEGGRLRAEVAIGEAGRDGALARYIATVLDAFQEVEGALVADGNLVTEIRALESAAEEAEAGFEISEERYLRGLTDVLTVLDARRRFFDAEAALVTTRLSRLTNRVDLHVALGGGFEGFHPPEESPQ